MIVVLMGVSGSGKTTVGKVLAERIGWRFADADDYHPPENVAKMRAGHPLNDEDRRPWLAALVKLVDEVRDRGENLVLACSALKHEYRDYLRDGTGDVVYIYLEGPEELIRERLADRRGHFMDPHLLRSQFEALEPPQHAIRVDIRPSPPEIAANIQEKLGIENSP